MPTDAEALVERAAALGCELSAADGSALLAYLDKMLELGRGLSLTAIRDREEAVFLHLLDSLAPAPLGLAPRRVLDLGSGNGFPGVALAVLWPQAAVTLMERTGKKVRAIEQCLRVSGLDRCSALHMDAAMAPALRPDLQFDLVAARAVAPAGEVAALAGRLLVTGGHLLLWQGSKPAPVPAGFTLARRLDYDLPSPRARRLVLALYERLPT